MVKADIVQMKCEGGWTYYYLQQTRLFWYMQLEKKCLNRNLEQISSQTVQALVIVVLCKICLWNFTFYILN